MPILTTNNNTNSSNSNEYESPNYNVRLVTIPRTARWRLQLGLLGVPPPPSPPQFEDEPGNSKGSNSVTSDNNGGEGRMVTTTVDEESSMVVVSLAEQKKQDSSSNISRRRISGTTKSLLSSKEKGNNSNNNKEKNKKKSNKRSVTLDDIESFDYNERMVLDQRNRFDLLAKRHMWKGSPLDNSVPSAASHTPPEESKMEPSENKQDLDPLSAILMEQEQQKQEIAEQQQRQKLTSSLSFKERRSSMFSSTRELITMIQKDLNRLPPFHHQMTQISLLPPDTTLKSFQEPLDQLMKSTLQDNPNTEQEDADDALRREERKHVLLHILFLYAKEYPDIGYRQGMHEVLSFALIALELDYVKFGTTDVLYNPTKILHDTYIMFEMIMYHLSPAYESAILKRPPHCTPQIAKRARPSSSPMTATGVSILAKVRRATGDPIYRHLSTINVPPQLYCTRWVRLMLARELSTVGGVLVVWDSFFSLISPHPQSATLMEVLEYASAVMIILLKDQIEDNIQNEENEGINNTIQLLMNYPCIEEAEVFLKHLRYLVFSNIYPEKNNKRFNPQYKEQQHMHQIRQEQQLQQTVQHTITTVQTSMTKAFTSLGGHYHNILNNVEKHYKDAIQKNQQDDSGSMTFHEMNDSMDHSIHTLKAFVRKMKQHEHNNENNQDHKKDFCSQHSGDIIDVITQLQKVKMNLKSYAEVYSGDKNLKNLVTLSDAEDNA